MPTSYISKIFGSSPIRPMEEHMNAVRECVQKLLPFVEAMLTGDNGRATELHGEIKELEREADRRKQELRLQMPNSLFMPVSRRDLLETLTMQDKVANSARDIASLMIGRNIQIPDSLSDQFVTLVNKSVSACDAADDAINELDELVETGFGVQVVELVEDMLTKLDTIESESDDALSDIQHALLRIEKQMDPIDAVFLYRLFEMVAQLADRAQRVGSRLQLMLAK